MTRDQLRVAAKQFNIPGRGSMNKAQLEAAVHACANSVAPPSDVPAPTVQSGRTSLSNRARKQARLSRRAAKLQG